MLLRVFAIAAFLPMLLACTATPEKRQSRAMQARTSSVNASFERDRAAILAMAGEFHVRFAFDETVVLKPGYRKHPRQRSKATEWVQVIEDRGDFISLQHILVLGDDHIVVKHWRQDWRYQPEHVLAFRGHRRWQRVPVAETERSGAWSQTVYEVDDSPRYAGVGRWTYENGVPAWTSAPIWRPLPRREYTKRSDYDVLTVVNRHLLTPDGWVHEQDNTKLKLHGDGAAEPLVKEFGVNTYTRSNDYDFTAGRDYWRKTAAFWAEARSQWNHLLTRDSPVTLRAEVDGKPLHDHLFDLADKSAERQKVDPDAIARVLRQFQQ